MKCPSDAQAALLALVERHESLDHVVEQVTSRVHWKPSRALLVIEHIDREKNTMQMRSADAGRAEHRLATVDACLRHGWLDDLHTRAITWPAQPGLPAGRVDQQRQLDLTEDGVIALGLWRERKLKAPAAPTPTMTDREREIADLAQRAIELGYIICAQPEHRTEANRMRRAGWLRDCWVANSPLGLVPSALALVEVRPDDADQPAQHPRRRSDTA